MGHAPHVVLEDGRRHERGRAPHKGWGGDGLDAGRSWVGKATHSCCRAVSPCRWKRHEYNGGAAGLQRTTAVTKAWVGETITNHFDRYKLASWQRAATHMLREKMKGIFGKVEKTDSSIHH